MLLSPQSLTESYRNLENFRIVLETCKRLWFNNPELQKPYYKKFFPIVWELEEELREVDISILEQDELENFNQFLLLLRGVLEYPQDLNILNRLNFHARQLHAKCHSRWEGVADKADILWMLGTFVYLLSMVTIAIAPPAGVVLVLNCLVMPVGIAGSLFGKFKMDESKKKANSFQFFERYASDFYDLASQEDRQRQAHEVEEEGPSLIEDEMPEAPSFAL